MNYSIDDYAAIQTVRFPVLGALVLACLVAGLDASAATDGTLKWNGSVGGGSWNDAANWTVTEGSYSVSELLARPCKYDFTGLASGAVVSNNTDNLQVGGIKIPGSVGTITLSGRYIFLPGEPTIDVGAGATLNWRLDHPNNWGGDGKGKVVISNSGTVNMDPPGDFQCYDRNFEVCGNIRLTFVKNCWFSLTHLVLWDNAKITLGSNMTVSSLKLAGAATELNLNGCTLTVGGGENHKSATVNGKITGNGNVVYSGGSAWGYGGSSDFAGDLRLYSVGLSATSGYAMSPNTHLCFDGAGTFAFDADQSLYHLSGSGATGGVVMPDGSTLTLTDDSGSARSSTFEGRIVGDNVVKTGADYTLTLTGDNSWTGATRVAAGILALERSAWKRGLVANWTFDDPDNLGRDYGPYGLHLAETIPDGGAGAIQRMDGVGHRPALQFNESAGDSPKASYFSVGSLRKDGAIPFPVEGDPISCSFWVRGEYSDFGGGAYLLRIGDWADGKQLAVWYAAHERLVTCILNYKTTDTSDSPTFNCTDISDGGWHHIAVTYATNNLCVWYDGELKRSTTSRDLVLSAGTTLRIGNDYPADSDHKFTGAVDDVRVWDHALSAAEVAEEYALGPSADDPAALLPDPVCHWSFDDSANPGKDEMGRADLVAYDGAAPSVATFAGGYGKTLDNSRMKLEAANFPEGFPTGVRPFTVSARFFSTGIWENREILCWGDLANCANSFALLYTACPRTLAVNCGNHYREKFSRSDNSSSGKDAFTHIVVTVDPARKVIRYFRDGAWEKTFTLKDVDITPATLYLNTQPGVNDASGTRFDDVRIYNTALSPYEVKTLSRSLATGSVGPVVPASSDVTVDAGASLVVRGEGHGLKSLAGAGNVVLDGPTSLALHEDSAFAGVVSGAGRLVLTNQMSSATISANVEIPSGATLAGDRLPIAVTGGTLIVPSTGTVAFPSSPEDGRHVVASGSSAVAADGIDGWTSNLNRKACTVVFAVEGGEFVAYTKRSGLILIVR